MRLRRCVVATTTAVVLAACGGGGGSGSPSASASGEPDQVTITGKVYDRLDPHHPPPGGSCDNLSVNGGIFSLPVTIKDANGEVIGSAQLDEVDFEPEGNTCIAYSPYSVTVPRENIYQASAPGSAAVAGSSKSYDDLKADGFVWDFD
jgi:hypothetical protein